jgi:DNA-binding transcriptional regulator of glucitol operon
VIGHVVVLALVVTMVFLGRWQLHVSEAKHFSLQNFGYALQWWAFSIFAVLMWLRILRDHARGSAASQPAEPATAPDPPVAYRRYVMPQSAEIAAVPTDATHAAYNEYLARLDEQARQRETERG